MPSKKTTADKQTKNVICENCDSEYKLQYKGELVSGDPEYCAFCGEEITEEDEDDFDFGDETDEDEG